MRYRRPLKTSFIILDTVIRKNKENLCTNVRDKTKGKKLLGFSYKFFHINVKTFRFLC